MLKLVRPSPVFGVGYLSTHVDRSSPRLLARPKFARGVPGLLLGSAKLLSPVAEETGSDLAASCGG
jgi:hypothetical protein